MNIQLPTTFKGDNFTDREAMMIALLYMITEDHGRDTWYNMHMYDYQSIIQGHHRGVMNPFMKKYENILKYIELAQVNENNILIKFRDLKALPGRGTRIGHYTHVLTDIECIKTWCYLIGKVSASDEVVSPTDSYIHYKEPHEREYGLKYMNGVLSNMKTWG